MANVFVFIPKSQPYVDDEVSPAEIYGDGEIHLFDNTHTDELAAANRIIADGAGFDISALVSALIQVAWSTITGKPTSFPPESHEHAGEDITSGTVAAARIAALDASKITTGVFDAARIPDLAASKITTGTLLDALIAETGVTQHQAALAIAFAQLTSTPTTLAGYGITDARTAAQITAEIDAALAGLVDSSPAALDTLNELAAALGDDPNFATTVNAAIAAKLDASNWVAATASNDGYMTQTQAAKLAGIEEGAEANTVDSVAGKTGAVTLDKGDVGLGNVDNTADADKPISTATQAALDDKATLDDLPFASIAEYTSTDTSTDLADASGAVIQWDTSRQTDSAIIIGGTNDTEISFGENGKYRVAVRLAYEDTSAEDTDVNNSVGLFFKLNGTGTGGQGIGSTVINTAGANEGQVWFEQVISISDYENQVVTVCTQRLSGADELYLRSGESTLIVEKVGGKSALLAAQTFEDIGGTADVDQLPTIPQSKIQDLITDLQAKAAASAVYTKTATDALLAGKVSTSDMVAALADKLDITSIGVSGFAASLDGSGKVPVSELPTGTSTAQIPILDGAGKLDISIIPDGIGGGGGLTVAAIKTSAFTPVIGEIAPVDTSEGGITLSGLPSDPEYGDEFALVAHNFSWSESNPVTVPGDDTINGQTRDLILDAPAVVEFRWTGDNFGWEAIVTLIEDPADYVEPHIARPTITSPANGATEVGETPTITSSAFLTVNGSDSHEGSDWKITSDEAGETVVVQSLDDTTNKTSWTVPAGNFATATTYYPWVRHTGTTYGDSEWSPAGSFTTEASFLDPDAASYIAAMTATPDATRQSVINALVIGLKSGPIHSTNTWTKIVAMWLLAAHDSQAARIDIKNPAGTKATAINSPAFTVDGGYAGDGSTSYLNTGNSSHGTTASAHIAIWRGADGSTAEYPFGAADGANRFSIGSLGVRGYVNSSNFSSVSGGPYTLLNRVDVSTVKHYSNGALAATQSAASTGVPSSYPSFLLAENTNGSPTNMSNEPLLVAHKGTALTDNEVADIRAVLNTYLTAIGAVS